MKKNKINEVVNESIQNLSNIIDVNTVIGNPVNIDDTVIIPIAKVTFCLLAGGGEYGKISVFKKSEDLPFAAANGSIISIKPCGFLIKNKKDDFKVLSVSNTNLDGIFDKVTTFYDSVTKNINNKENVDE